MTCKNNIPATSRKDHESSDTHYLGGNDASLHPVKISRATKKMSSVKKFYNEEIGVDQVLTREYADKSELLIVMFKYPEHEGI